MSLNEDRAFSNIYKESLRRPTTNELDERWRDAVFRKGSGAASSH